MARLGSFGLFYYGPLQHYWRAAAAAAAERSPAPLHGGISPRTPPRGRYAFLNARFPTSRALPLRQTLVPFVTKARQMRRIAPRVAYIGYSPDAPRARRWRPTSWCWGRWW